MVEREKLQGIRVKSGNNLVIYLEKAYSIRFYMVQTYIIQQQGLMWKTLTLPGFVQFTAYGFNSTWLNHRG